VSAPHHDATGAADLDRVERDLAGVEAALARLDDGTYWTDEVTGQPLGDELLAADPVARRQSEAGGSF
jgi:RNA polymerase-binding transcription factor DksA